MKGWEIGVTCAMIIAIGLWVKLTDYQITNLEKRHDAIEKRVEVLEHLAFKENVYYAEK